MAQLSIKVSVDAVIDMTYHEFSKLRLPLGRIVHAGTGRALTISAMVVVVLTMILCHYGNGRNVLVLSAKLSLR